MKGNLFLGMGRGSVGDVTFYRGRGQQIARARNRNPKNPRSSAQVIQRMILATASKAYSQLKSIANHSFQGVTYGGESQSYFLKRAMDDIRKFVSESLAMAPATITDPLRQIGLAWPNDVHEAGFGLLLSQGSIPSIPVTFVDSGEDKVFDHIGAIMDKPSYIPDVLDALGAAWGDQITVCGILENGDFVYSRYVTESNPDPESLEDAWDGGIQSAAFDQSKSLLDGKIVINVADEGANNRKIIPEAVGGGVLAAFAVIISRQVNGIWERSTQRLISINPVDNVPAVIAMWELGTTPVGVNSPFYLNNADD